MCRLFSFEGCATAHTGPQPAGLAKCKREPRHKIQACHGHAIVCLVNGNAAFSPLQTNSRQLFASRNSILQNQITSCRPRVCEPGVSCVAIQLSVGASFRMFVCLFVRSLL